MISSNRSAVKLSVLVLASLLLQVMPVQGQDLVWARQMGGAIKDAPWGVAVDGNGDMAVCCRGPGPRPEMGNISGGLEAWRGGAMEKLRARVYDPERKPEKCLLCKANWSMRR